MSNSFSAYAINIFNHVINQYHEQDHVDAVMPACDKEHPEDLLHEKCWIDTVQWHLEDIIRDPTIEPLFALEIKRRIDTSNQYRTNIVEVLDDYFMAHWAPKQQPQKATLNTESPAWAIDRLSILCLKIYHMREETLRTDVDVDHLSTCQSKLNVLLEQLQDLSLAIDQLLQNILEGRVQMKLYRQMKMYNDPNLNPVLYRSTES